ncbi:BTAD domain-containing putative transcriptional regulator [Kitasatospora sp. NPDC059160]|uniref:BTAD domain-containing putative transcriptional regulator n=1 Tax=Kitasatospora sp. NPDC059160 TaxID=3346748 RepID=UPI003693182F
MQFSVLGRLTVRDGSGEVGVSGARLRSLLAVLLLHANRPVATDRLQEALWNDGPPASGAAAVHNLVARLRRVLSDGTGRRISATPLGYLLAVADGELDCRVFEHHVGRARAAFLNGEWDAVHRETAAALALWQGEPLAELADLHEARAPREQWCETRLQVLEWHFEAQLNLGRHHGISADLAALAAEHPFREAFHRLLMCALHRTDRTAQALEVYRTLRRKLDDELGIEPGRATQDVHQRILATDGDPATAPEHAPTASLPRDVRAFVGRREEVDLVLAACRRGAGAGGVLGIHAVDGMPGIGKSAFAVHCAHRLASDFPDGQIFLPLHAHTPGTRAVEPAEALAELLLAVGVAPRRIPSEPSARAGMWRSQVAGRRILLLLDDALSSEQVRPLLPGAPGTLVLVTSRRRLVGLEDTVPVTLDVLPPQEAAALFTAGAGRPGLLPTEPAVVETVRLCGYLPLAVGLMAARLRHHPSWSVADLVVDLTGATGRLEALRAGTTSVAAVFDLSYQHLPADLRRLFRRLGLHPGDDFDAYAAAALDDTDLPTARQRLEALEDHHLIEEPVRGRYRMHDLLREHARDLAGADRPDERGAAVDRLLDYYLAAGTAADRHFARHSLPAPGRTPCGRVPDLSTPERGTAWLQAERANLHAAVEFAGEHDRPLHAVRLPSALHEFLRGHGHWEQADALHRIALDTAVLTDDRLGQAHVLVHLARLRDQRGRLGAAAELLLRARALYRALGERLGEAYTLFSLSDVQQSEGRYEAAIESCRASLAIHREAGDRPGEANVLVRLGFVQQLAGHTGAAAENLRPALALFRTLGDRGGQANVLFNLGLIGEKTGHYEDAARDHSAALALFRTLGNRFGQANAHLGLGLVQEATGRYREAADSHRAGLEILRSTGNPIGHADALTFLARVQLVTGTYEAAAGNLRAALETYRTAGVRRGELDALVAWGGLLHETGQHAAAVEQLQQALAGIRDLGIPPAEARALVHLGDAQRAAGELDAAAGSLRRALALCSGLQHPGIEAETLNALGRLLSERARWAEARTRHTEALRIARAIRHPLQETRALEGMAKSFQREGNSRDAEEHLRQALTVARQLAVPDAERIRGSLYDVYGAGAHGEGAAVDGVRTGAGGTGRRRGPGG